MGERKEREGGKRKKRSCNFYNHGLKGNLLPLDILRNKIGHCFEGLLDTLWKKIVVNFQNILSNNVT